MQLPLNLPSSQMVTRWASLLNPILANIFVQGRFIPNVSLKASTPLTLNHQLGGMMNGYSICGQDAEAQVWFTKPFNSLTLTLEASADVTIFLWVF